MPIKSSTPTLPHSWDLRTWPEGVWPNSDEAARRLLRSHRAELQAAGALTRIGRNLVFMGAGYQKWLASQAPNVTQYDVPMNRPEHASKRFGGAAS
ncbi:MAG TPA: hypothetical protein VGI90_14505 [Steroidobacteraceae bacterium]|jgi:hypothetical protein